MPDPEKWRVRNLGRQGHDRAVRAPAAIAQGSYGTSAKREASSGQVTLHHGRGNLKHVCCVCDRKVDEFAVSGIHNERILQASSSSRMLTSRISSCQKKGWTNHHETQASSERLAGPPDTREPRNCRRLYVECQGLTPILSGSLWRNRRLFRWGALLRSTLPDRNIGWLKIRTAVNVHGASSLSFRSLTASEQASISPAAHQMSACIADSRNKTNCRESRTCTLPRRRPPSFRRSDLWLPASVAEGSFSQ